MILGQKKMCVRNPPNILFPLNIRAEKGVNKVKIYLSDSMSDRINDGQLKLFILSILETPRGLSREFWFMAQFTKPNED